jgi:hypothetical protein
MKKTIAGFCLAGILYDISWQDGGLTIAGSLGMHHKLFAVDIKTKLEPIVLSNIIEMVAFDLLRINIVENTLNDICELINKDIENV